MKVKTVFPFEDRKANKERKVGEEFTVSKARYAEIKKYEKEHNLKLIEPVEKK